MSKRRGSGFVRTPSAPGFSVAAQFRAGRAANKRTERLKLEAEAADIARQEKELADRKEDLRRKELEAQGRGIIARGQRG